jgi:hypothetical protein
VKDAMRRVAEAHNEEETAGFTKSIERKALSI